MTVAMSDPDWDPAPQVSARHTGWFLPNRSRLMPTETVLRAVLLVNVGAKLGITADVEYFPSVSDTELKTTRDLAQLLDGIEQLEDLIEYFPLDRVVAIHLYVKPSPGS